MRADCALLCDSASVREGLLHILGGGIGTVTRPSYPAPLGVMLALHLLGTRDELAQSHRIEVRGQDPNGNDFFRFSAEFGVSDISKVAEGAEVPFALAIPLGPVPLGQTGRHVIEVVLDGDDVIATLPVMANVDASGQPQRESTSPASNP